MIANKAHSEILEDTEVCNFLDFSKADPTFYDFPKSQAGDSEPPKSLEINPTCTYIPSPVKRVFLPLGKTNLLESSSSTFETDERTNY